MPQFSLAGKTAVITGAARGIGFAFAEALASAGSKIAILDVLPEPTSELESIRNSYKVQVAYYKTDITSREQVNATITQVESDFGAIHVTVCAAGIVRDEPFLETTDSNIERTFSVNVTGSILVAQACAKSMAKRYHGQHGDASAKDPTTGAIVFIASISTYVAEGAQNISTYVASKSAVKGMVKPLAMELARYGIRVNSLSPGYTMTDMMRGLQEKEPKLVRQMEKETLFGRIGMPDELKGAILYLCSDAGR